ncbi:MAG: peptide deformylase [Opitutales bacterium]|nr:peptide deformylase [Opitutales bacterium]
MIRRITKYGEDVLRQVAKPVEKFDTSIKQLADDMVETMYEANGLGLAAPQVNESLAMFVIDMRRRLNSDAPCEFTIDGKALPLDIAMPLVAINPKLELIGEYVEVCEEGCLSFPNIFAEVERIDVVKLNYQDINGVEHELICNDLFARCVQHEFDHLQGICFVNRVEKKNISKIETKLKKLRRETRDFLKTNK